MRYGGGRLQEQQALFRILGADAGTDGFRRFSTQDLVDATLDDPSIVLPGMASVQGELEAAASLDSPMTFGRVTPTLGEDSSDVPGKAEGSPAPSSLDPHGCLGAVAIELGGYQGLAIGYRRQSPLSREQSHRRVTYANPAPPCHIPLKPVRVGAQHHQFLGGINPHQPDPLGGQPQRKELRLMRGKGSRSGQEKTGLQRQE